MEIGRRGFMEKAFGAVAGVGAVASLYAMKRTWDPLPSVRAAGFTTLDMSIYKDNVLVIEKWRGKPIFVIKKSPEMVEKMKSKDNPYRTQDIARDVVVQGNHYTMCVGLCTHLGCIPLYRPGDLNFLCPCHGGMYDFSGMVTKPPPPRGFDIPPFKIEGNKLVLGVPGPEYKEMLKNHVTLPV
jgi:ubiquinol-cytochrome c reductase iron-sulfur subunit